MRESIGRVVCEQLAKFWRVGKAVLEATLRAFVVFDEANEAQVLAALRATCVRLKSARMKRVSLVGTVATCCSNLRTWPSNVLMFEHVPIEGL